MNDTDLLKRIKRLENDVLGYKTFQPIGSDSVRTFTTMTNNEWDVDVVLVESFAGASFGQIDKRIRFKADNQKAPFVRLRAFAEFDGIRYDYSTNSRDTLNTTIDTVLIQDDWYAINRQETVDPGLLRLQCLASGSPGKRVKLKFAIDATDTGRMYFVGEESETA